jgi:hypothetical protein
MSAERFTALDFALALLRRGLSIIPVPRPDAIHDGKVPGIKWKRFQTERATEDQVKVWFQGEQNIAIITGTLSGVVVVDVDSPEAEEWARLRLPRTPWRVRTAKGTHRFYRHPGTPVPNRAKIITPVGQIALDVRGDGGFVIAPGSLHKSGVSYEAVGDWSVPALKLPAFWLGWIARPRPAPIARHAAGPRPHGDAAKRAGAYLAAIPRPVIGQGSDNATFYAACRLVRGFLLDPKTAVELLIAWSGFEREWVERKVECAVKYGNEDEGAMWEAK